MFSFRERAEVLLYWSPASRPYFSLLLFIFICLSIHHIGDAAAQTKPAVLVTSVLKSDLRPEQRYSGRAVAVSRADIRVRVEGVVTEVKFDEGSQVKKGDVLYEVDPAPFIATINEINASLQAAEAERRLAEIERDRKAALLDKKTIAASELDVAEASLAKAQAEVARLTARLERAKFELSHCTIAAPFDGIVGISKVDVGAFVDASTGALTTLTQMDPMGIEIPVATSTLVTLRQKRLQNGGERASEGEVTLTLPNGSAYKSKGKVDFVGVRTSESTDTTIIRAIFSNPDLLILDGALVGVSLIPTEPSLVLNVPQRAVQRDQLGSFVLVVDSSGMVEERRITVERTSNGRSIIAKGLDEGENVIVEGLTKVRPGDTVDAKKLADG